MPSKSSFFRRSADAQTDASERETREDETIEQYVPRKREPRQSANEQDDKSQNSPDHYDSERPTRSPRIGNRDSSYSNDDRPFRKPVQRDGDSSARGRDNDSYRGRNDNDRSVRGRDNNDRPSYRGRDNGNDSNRGRDNDRGDFSRRPPRGERVDYRKPENKNPKYDEEREAPENVIYGIHPVKEAIQTGKQIEKIYFRRNSSADDARYGNFQNNDALDQIRDMLVGSNIVSQDVPPEKLDRLSRRGNHQGVVAVVPEIDYMDFNDLLEKLASSEIPPLVVVMDSVTDVRNFGAIARSAECAGADAVIMSAKNSAPVNAEAIRSSAGALNIIPVCRVGSLRNSLKSLQMAGMQLVAATEKAENILFEADLTKPTVIIMGSEDKGISNEVLKMCDSKVSIPLLGRIDSLNVSAAASVMLFEAVRQRFMAIDTE